MKSIFTVLFVLSLVPVFGQDHSSADSLKSRYKTDMREVSNSFSRDFYPNRTAIYSLNRKAFLTKIDSLKKPFAVTANSYAGEFATVDKLFIPAELKDIDYFFDRILLDYPYYHETHTGKKASLPNAVRKKLTIHQADFNDPAMLKSRDFQDYVMAFLRHESSRELKKKKYRNSNNKRLDAYFNLLPGYFHNADCREYWEYHYLYNHLDNWGSKDIANTVHSFLENCQNKEYRQTIDSMYTESRKTYEGHVIRTYKTVDGHNLDLHLFLPDSSYRNPKRPVIVYFSGGSWTEGTPEWDFYNCVNYAKQGWVAVSVEYRVADRFETGPVEAVKDARSAIRWLRTHANDYNMDTSRIVASGNSAGGHLVLATALAEDVNERTDNPAVSARPNLLLVNAGVYDLFFDGRTDWIHRGGRNKKTISKISPIQLIRTGLPPMLIIHGTNDQSVDYASAKLFAEALQKTGDPVEFETLEGAPHYIWYDRRFSSKVRELRTAFLAKYGY